MTYIDDIQNNSPKIIGVGIILTTMILLFGSYTLSSGTALFLAIIASILALIYTIFVRRVVKFIPLIGSIIDGVVYGFAILTWVLWILRLLSVGFVQLVTNNIVIVVAVGFIFATIAIISIPKKVKRQ